MTACCVENLLIPTLKLPTIFHVGTMNISKKGNYSFESNAGLSVSTKPDAWRRINKGRTNGDTFQLDNPDARFLDVAQLSDEQYQKIQAWAVQKELLIPCKKYEFSYYDDEMEEELCFSFDSQDEAEIESDGEHDVRTIDSYKGTESLAKIIGQGNIDNISLILVAYCMLETNLDGVYWDSKVDVLRYTAPRGIILQNMLERWKISN